ncbi:MAG: efflux RND transporter permease subunit [Saccharofermentans sp.]|nr:efflux RND transporter permease subunit [Saccharofermentans sp.]
MNKRNRGGGIEGFSVRKPFTVLVAVIAVIAMSLVSLRNITTDLLPAFGLPYLLVITTYPGASPERVEEQVGKPMERTLGTVSGVKNVYTINQENYCVTELEFEDGTDMDSAMVRVSEQLAQVTAQLPDMCGTPSIMELSLDMVATTYISVTYEGMDIYELSEFVNDEVLPYIERQDGVASVNAIGLIEKSIKVDLNQKKIDALNDKILETVNEQLEEAREALDEARRQVEEGQAALEQSEAAFGSTMSSAIFSQFDSAAESAANTIKNELFSLISILDNLSGIISAAENIADEAEEEVDSISAAISETREQLSGVISTLNELQNKASELQSSIEEAQAKLEEYSEQGLEEDQAALEQEIEAMQAELEEIMQQISEGTATQEELEAKLQELTAELGEAAENAQITAIAKETQEKLSALASELNELIAELNTEAGQIDGSSVSALISSVSDLMQTLGKVSALLSQIENISPAGSSASEAASSAKEMLQSLYDALDDIPALLATLESTFAGLTQAQLDAAVQFSAAASQLTQAQEQLNEAEKQYEEGKAQALESADVDKLLTAAMLSQLIYAQNFAMPAGYIDDENDQSWLLKVGDEYDNTEDIAQAFLVDNDLIGTVRLSDIADVTIIDNYGETYAKLNGSDAIILTVFKSSTASTNAVSDACAEALDELKAEYPGFTTVTIVDQGQYIDLILDDVVSSIITGALLAIAVLAIFLGSLTSTLVVAVSIPLSVMFALLLIYFTGYTLNIMTLAGLALGIGMLVDNSIVVMENIFRLRQKGIAPARAAVQGAKQVKSSIVASTLTTVCVFFPLVFTSGTVRDLLLPLGLTVGYCLAASLLAALTVVPAASSTLMKNVREKKHNLSEKIQNIYGNTLRWCLNHKIVPLGGAIALLAFSVYFAVRTGIVFLPNMSTNEISIQIEADEGLTAEEINDAVELVTERILEIDEIENISIMDMNAASSTAGGLLDGNTLSLSGSFSGYVTAGDDTDTQRIARICEEIEAASEGTGCTVKASAGDMTEMSTYLTGTGLTMYLYGKDADTLKDYSKELVSIIEAEPGFTNVSDGTEDGDKTLHLVIDKDKAIEYGLTVAQIYTTIASRIETSVVSTTITVDGAEMDVIIYDTTDPVTKENLLEIEFETQSSASSAVSTSSFSVNQEAEDTDEEAEDEPTSHKLKEFATVEETMSLGVINRKNQTRYMTITADLEEGENLTLKTRELSPKIKEWAKTLPQGYKVETGGQSIQINDMLSKMGLMIMLSLLLIYLIMVAQFQSLLSPFIVMFTIPLAFTGGMVALLISGEQISLLSLMGFLILIGTVVNNGIVFVDYTNQLRIGGLERREALVATGKTRMRPILMTALTTILAMSMMIFGTGMASQLGKGMSIVIAGGLMYATLMTLYIVPVMYDILFKKKPLNVDVGSDLDEAIDDAAEYLASLNAK